MVDHHGHVAGRRKTLSDKRLPRLVPLPQSAAVAEQGWQGLLSISELTRDYTERYGTINPRQVMAFMVKDAEVRQFRSLTASLSSSGSFSRLVASGPTS